MRYSLFLLLLFATFYHGTALPAAEPTAWDKIAEAIQRQADNVETIKGIDRFIRPESPAGRDYAYTLVEKNPDPARHPNLGYYGGEPFATHRLDGQATSWLSGAFLIPKGASRFAGMAVKISRDGRPGDLELQFGSRVGESDLGVAKIAAEAVLPLYDVWQEARIAPLVVRENQPVYWQLRASPSADTDDHYLVYGPKLCNNILPSPAGRGAEGESGQVSGIGSPPFTLSYRVLTDRPQDRIEQPGKQYTFQHVKKLLGPYYADEPALRLKGKPAGPDETAIAEGWSVHFAPDAGGVMAAAAADLKQFLSVRAGIGLEVAADPEKNAPRTISLVVSDDAELLKTIDTEEGYRIEVGPDRISVIGKHPRGVMRGVYWIEEQMRFRGAACLKRGMTERNCKFRRRMVTSISVAERTYDAASYPMVYTDGLLQSTSHQGFNAIWFYLNLEEITFDSRVFPELNNPNAKRVLARLKDLVDRARPYGIDIIPYFGTNNHLPVPESFYAKHPDCRGVGWGNALCTSHPDVQRYLGESVQKLFQVVPGLKGFITIFDSEGFFHCALHNQSKCPRCRERKPDDVAVEFIDTIYSAMKAANPIAEMIVWSYGGAIAPKWVDDVIPRLPKGVIFQTEFGKGEPVVRDGITNVTEDYNITTVGPPEGFLRQYALAKRAGVRMTVKTEHAISQEFVTVPYIPCMRQWHARIAKMSEYELDGYLGNWCHYGYMPSRPTEILMWYSWTNAPPLDELLERMARRDFGPAAAPHVLIAWEHVTRGIEQFPYSDPIARYPGPLQKGPSQPLLLDPKIKNFGAGRAWQNDLAWTKPWGPEIAEKYLRIVEEEFSTAVGELKKARQTTPSPELDAEIRVVEIMRRSLHTMVNLIRWIPLRDKYAKAEESERSPLRTQLLTIAQDELTNAEAALALTESDSRLGTSSEAVGCRRGGLFSPALIRVKIEMLEDVLKQLAKEIAPVPTRIYENRLTRIADPKLILADYPQWVEPIREVTHYEAPPLVLDDRADLEVRAWRYSYNARGIIEMPDNRLRGADTALVVVHPWGIDDGQGWKSPEPAGAADFCTPAKNHLSHKHIVEVLNPFIQSLRGRVGLVIYSMRNGEHPIHKKLYRSIRRSPTVAERAEGQKELTALLGSFNYNAEPLLSKLSLSSDKPVVDYFKRFAGLDPGPRYNGAGFWDLPTPVIKAIDMADDDVVAYDNDGYPALRDFLKQKGIRHVLLGGYCTDMCVRATTAGYLNLRNDFNVFLVGDATLATFPAAEGPAVATSAAVRFAAIDLLVTQVSWIKPSTKK
jgi:hypothetical protein